MISKVQSPLFHLDAFLYAVIFSKERPIDSILADLFLQILMVISFPLHLWGKGELEGKKSLCSSPGTVTKCSVGGITNERARSKAPQPFWKRTESPGNTPCVSKGRGVARWLKIMLPSMLLSRWLYCLPVGGMCISMCDI